MKLAGARALAFCDKPQGKTRIALIFGGDPGLVSTASFTSTRTPPCASMADREMGRSRPNGPGTDSPTA